MDGLLKIAGGAAIMVVTVLLGQVIRQRGLASAEAAAWVQAIGTIAAILAAIWIDQGAARSAARERGEAARSVVDARKGALVSAATAIKDVRDELAAYCEKSVRPPPLRVIDYSTASAAAGRLRTQIKILKRFSAGDFGPAEVMGGLLIVKHELQQTVAALDFQPPEYAAAPIMEALDQAVVVTTAVLAFLKSS